MITPESWLCSMFCRTLCLASIRLHDTLQVLWCYHLQKTCRTCRLKTKHQIYVSFPCKLTYSFSTVCHVLQDSNSNDQACASSVLLILARGRFITLFLPHLTSQTKNINFLQQDHRNESYHKMLWAVNQNKDGRITCYCCSDIFTQIPFLNLGWDSQGRGTFKRTNAFRR